MNTYYIDFEGYCKIDANSRAEAEKKFWDGLQKPSIDSYDDVYDIENVEVDSYGN